MRLCADLGTRQGEGGSRTSDQTRRNKRRTSSPTLRSCPNATQRPVGATTPTGPAMHCSAQVGWSGRNEGEVGRPKHAPLGKQSRPRAPSDHHPRPQSCGQRSNLLQACTASSTRRRVSRSLCDRLALSPCSRYVTSTLPPCIMWSEEWKR